MSTESRTLEFALAPSQQNASGGRRLACNKLRVDPGDGSPPEDYRIENGHVERRVLDSHPRNPRKGGEWLKLSREQLASHVMSNTAVARWLQRRMGVHRLIRACAPPSDAEPPQRDFTQHSHAA